MTAPVPRLNLLAFPYELIHGDLLVASDASTKRVTSVAGAATVTVTFADDTTADHPRQAILTVYRDQSAVPGFSDVDPFIVA
ncbi:MAG: hypothetical protein JWO98_2256 [Frankiales bacterium]|nr:hypothetical protein [Frankiales bacterium]